MDEPLSNLDAQLRVQTRTEIGDLQRRLGVTTVYVTHDQVEAMTLGDRVVVLKDGVVQQIDTPIQLYEQPCNSFVAGFMGSPAMNLLDLDLNEHGARLGDVTLPIERTILDQLAKRGAGTVTIGIRPEDLRLGDQSSGFPLSVEVVEALGAESYVYGRLSLPDGSERQLVLRTEARAAPSKGSIAHVNVTGDQLHVFDPGSGERLAA